MPTVGAMQKLACRFAGSSVLQEDRASRRLEVDEHGLPCREAADIWSAATSRGPSCAVSTTTSQAASRYPPRSLPN